MSRFVAPRGRKWLAFLVFCAVSCCSASASALSVLSISATANCDAVTGMTFSGTGAATIQDGAGILVAWVGAPGPFIPFEGPTDNRQWTVTDSSGPITIVPSNFAAQCAPASLTVSAGNVNAAVVFGSAAPPPSRTYTLTNTGGSSIYLPATPFFPNGVAFFHLTGPTSIGPGASTTVTIAFNPDGARTLAPGRYNASVTFSNAADLSVVTSRQVNLTVVVAATHDFNRDFTSDIAWRESAGATQIWLMNAAQLVVTGSLGTIPSNWQIVGQRDFNGDGKTDWLWRDGSTGTVAIWLLNGLQVAQAAGIGAVPSNWVVAGTGDFNGDGMGDILWRDTTSGTVALWLMNGVQILQVGSIGAVPPNWAIVGVGDFDGDGISDILWRDMTTGNVAIWLINGLQVPQAGALGMLATNWTVAGTGDFDGDGQTDILWRDGNTGTVAIWLMHGLQVSQTGALGAVPGNWIIAQTGDFNNDGMSDLLWRDTSSGAVAMWFLNGLQVSSSAGVAIVGLDWTIQVLNAD